MAEKVKFVLEVDSKGAITSMKKLETSSKTSTDKMSKNFLSLSNVIKGSVILAIGATIVKMKEVGLSSIDLASDLEETQGKFDVVFRGMSKTAEGWSKDLRDSYAMAESESKKYLSSIQDLLVPTGLAREEAGMLSMAFVKMAADLGSFNNRETVDVIRDIQSALQGGSETMAKYGINVKAAKVEAEIFRLGLAKTKDEITDAHKAQAIYNIIMRDGADAIGDMDRTSGSYANQLKKLKANINDLTTAVGVELLPKMTEIITEMNNWVKQNDELIKQKIPEYVDGIKNSIVKLFELYEKMPNEAFEFGLIGFMLLGRKGAAIGIGLSAIKDYAIDAADAIRFIQEGLMDFDETTGSLEKFYKALERARMFDEYNKRDRSQDYLNEPGVNGNGVGELNISKDFSGIYKKESEERVEWSEKSRQQLWEIETAITKMYKYESDQRKESATGEFDDLVKFRSIDLESMKEYNKYKTEIDKQYSDEKKENLKIINEMISYGMTDALMDWIDGTQTAEEAFRSFASSFLKQMAEMIIQQAIFNALKDASDSDGIVGSIIGFLTPKAEGGPVSSNSPYLVGEEGPELFVPNSSGSITPNNQLGGGGGLTVVNNIQVDSGAGGDEQDRQELSKQIAQAIDIKIKQSLVEEKRYGGLLY